MNKSQKIIFVTLVLVALPGFGSGFGLYEQGVQGVGNLGAFVARAEDASTLYHNPAGLAQLTGVELSFSGRLLASKNFYSNPGQSNWETDGQLDGVPNFFSSFQKGPVTFGIGSTTSYFHELDWKQPDYPGRFLGKRAEVVAREHLAGMAIKLNKRFSFGAAFRFAQVDTLQSRILARPFDPSDLSLFYQVEETFESEGEDFGFSVGFHYLFPRRFSIGITYWSPIKIDLNGERSFALFRGNDPRARAAFEATFRGAPLTSMVELPERIAVGFATKVTVRTRVEFDVSLEKWSVFEETVYDTEDNGGQPERLIFPRGWDDSLSIRAAGDFQQRKALLWRAALGTASGIVPDDTLDPYFPDDNRFMYSVGVSYTLRKKYVFEAAWIYMQNRDRETLDQEYRYDPNAPDYVSSTGQQGLFETQRTGLNLGFRIKFGQQKREE